MGYLGTNYLSVPRDQWKVRISNIKDMWKDYREEQRVFPDLISNLEYDKAIIRACIRFNEFPPISTNFSPMNFHKPGLLSKMAFSEVLGVIINYHASNYFTGTSGGSQVVTHERIDKIAMIREMLEREIQLLLTTEKDIMNNDAAYGTVYNYLGMYGTGY